MRTNVYRPEKPIVRRPHRPLEWAWLESPDSTRKVTARVQTFNAHAFNQAPFNASIPAARPHAVSNRVQTFNSFAFNGAPFNASLGPGIFTPKSISGLVLWLDSSQPTTLQNSPTGSPPSSGITSATAVGTWFDNSGSNTTTFSQATSANQPTYYSSGGAIANAGPYVELIPASVSGGVDTNGQQLTERSLVLHSDLASDNTVLILLYKYSAALDAGYQTFFTNVVGSTGSEFLMRQSGDLTRFSSSLSVPMSDSAIHAVVYTYASGTTTENLYLDSSAAPAATNSAGRPTMANALFSLGNPSYTANGQYYEVIAYNSALANTQISEILAYWNTKWGTGFNTSSGPLTAPSVMASNVQKTSQTVAGSSPSGGIFPYSYQWYRSTTNGTAAAIAVPGNAIGGATTLSYTDTGLVVQTVYYYVLAVTDSFPTTVLSAVLTSQTHGPHTLKIGFIGDSITAGLDSTTTPVAQFALALQAAHPDLDTQPSNYGVGGQTLRVYSRLSYPGGTNGGGAVTSLLSTLNTAGINWLCIMEGTNDWALSPYGPSYNSADNSFTGSNYVADMTDIASCLTTGGIRVVINQLIYRTNTNADDPVEGIPPWNTGLAGMSYSGLLYEGDTVSYAQFKANAVAWLADGIHPNTTGSIQLGENWELAIGSTIDTLTAVTSNAILFGTTF